MNKEFKQAISLLESTNEQFSGGHISSVYHSQQREAALTAGIHFMGKSFGVDLGNPSIDSNGEMSINVNLVATTTGSQYGLKLAKLLNRFNPRTGVTPSAHLLAESNWCRMHHFEVERMLMTYYEENI